ncbi:MAG: SIMPL domain-containing protein [Candidatus Melainabacteria bacterium HGW-Melainabacteria-1]|nr:MAG: SIMPL domain-containing protein [Candidatus Melainabacteria bacterium HGW-Melainabacteria-1]
MSEGASFPQLFSGLAALSLALVVSAWIGGQSIQRFKAADNTISVTGAARKPIKADFGVMRASISSERPSQKEAYTDLQSAVNQVRDYFVNEQQIPAAALSLGSISTSSVPELLPNGNSSGKTRAWRLHQELEIRLDDVARIQKLAQDSSELLARDISFEAYPPEYLYTKLGDLRVQMLAEATQDAKLRAEQIVKSAGSQLGPVRSVRTGVFQITRSNSTETSDGGMYDTSTIDKDITAVLTMTFAVE